MRIITKGGVWKNTEDEILKAAVMKYGNNCWPRVASLLSRKTSKQCKARWYEWLDPSIRKTDWSREEEEKLLHLAKLMPGQWRTISPIIGRTAGQCIEHYERILDQSAQDRDGGLKDDDPRKLRAGEIDPQPESKPARPDPIDMDEDEKEMLLEARARLSNTQGKKEKRKGRERQLEDSRRLAILQKRRELKAAGVLTKLETGPKKRKHVDYATEVPLQQNVPAGFYDVGEEEDTSKRSKMDPKTAHLEVSKMEGKHVEEEKKRQKKLNEKKHKEMYSENAPQAIMDTSEQNDPMAFHRRSALSLPAPMVSDSELEDIAKVNRAGSMGPPSMSSSANFSTGALLGDHQSSNRSLSSIPQRTPMQENIVLQEARNHLALRSAPTPLSGEEMPELQGGTGFSGAMPTPRDSLKMNTPGTSLSQRGDSSMSMGYGSQTPMGSTMGDDSSVAMSHASRMHSPRGGNGVHQTPLRDELSLNQRQEESDDFSVTDYGSVASSTFTDASRFNAMQKQKLMSSLKGLPEPEYSYEINMPEVEEDGDVDQKKGRKLDEAEIRSELARESRLKEEAELARRTQSVKRYLPRPIKYVNISTDSIDDKGARLIRSEFIRLIEHDQYQNPISFKDNKQLKLDAGIKPVHLEIIEYDYLKKAAAMLKEEVNVISSEHKAFGEDEFQAEWNKAHENRIFIPSKESFGVTKKKNELLESLRSEFDEIKSSVSRSSNRAKKIESKINIISQGHINRTDSAEENLERLYTEYTQLSTEILSLKKLQQNEKNAILSRTQGLRTDLSALENEESVLQRKYQELSADLK